MNVIKNNEFNTPHLINIDFDIPYYIFEEIVEYIEQTAQGKCRCSKWENIKSLLSLAVVNGRMTREQADSLIEKYNREEY